MSIWWLSFVGGEPEHCLGVVITEADTIEDAAAKAHRLGINPGGECAGFEIPEDEPEAERERDPAHRDKLLSTDEVARLFDAKPLREWEAN